jgi:hypothetical protein
MSFKEKNIIVTLVNFSIILAFFLLRLLYLLQTESFNEANIFSLWGVIIFFAVVVTILATIMTHILSVIMEAVRTGTSEPEVEDMEDERDKLIHLKGTQVIYTIYSIGAFFAMLTFVLGQPPLVMFTLLIFFGVLAQIIGDIVRLLLYRRGV